MKTKLLLAARNFDIYLLLVPALACLIIFKYVPMYGISIAFQDFNIFKGIAESPWVGVKHFERLFTSPDFRVIFFNTLTISVMRIVFVFPIPIFMAIVLNEIGSKYFKKTVQTLIYLPHFLSWVIVSGIFVTLLSPSTGIVNNIIAALGGERIPFLMSNKYFRGVLVFTGAWKEVGYSAIVYIAAITGIDQEQYEAARVDGAGRLKQIWHITLPGMSSIILLMFILRLGSLLEGGTEQVLLMYNAAVYETGDVIGTYVYRMGLGKQEYSFSTAVGLFESIIAFTLVMSGNYISGKVSGRTIW